MTYTYLKIGQKHALGPSTFYKWRLSKIIQYKDIKNYSKADLKYIWDPVKHLGWSFWEKL